MSRSFEPLELRTLFAAGDLDSTFGTGGVGTIELSERATMPVADITATDNAGLIAVGERLFLDADDATRAAGIARFTPDGTPDSRFGENGFLVDTPGGMLAAMAVENVPSSATGQFYVAGIRGGTPDEPQRVVLARYDGRGRHDKRFDSRGRGSVIVPALRSVHDIEVLTDGSVLLAGVAQNRDGAVVKLNSAGQIVRAFGAGGITATTPRDNQTFVVPGAIDVDSQGRIVLGLSIGSLTIDNPVHPEYGVHAWRFTPDGAPDLDFSSDGQVFAPELISPQGFSDAALRGMVADPNNDAVLLYYGNTLGSDFQVVRFTSTGVLDNQFGFGDGILTMSPLFNGPSFQPTARHLVVSRSLTIYASGTRSSLDGDTAAAIERIPRGGSPGQSVQLAVIPGLQDVRAMLFSPDETLVVAGSEPLAGPPPQGEGGTVLASRVFLDARPTSVATFKPVIPGSKTAAIWVTYRGNTPLDLGKIDARDLRVTFPDGTAHSASVLSSHSDAGGTVVTVRYRFVAPGGTWDESDNGDYQVRLRHDEVADVNGSNVEARILGTIRIRL